MSFSQSVAVFTYLLTYLLTKHYCEWCSVVTSATRVMILPWCICQYICWITQKVVYEFWWNCLRHRMEYVRSNCWLALIWFMMQIQEFF